MPDEEFMNSSGWQPENFASMNPMSQQGGGMRVTGWSFVVALATILPIATYANSAPTPAQPSASRTEDATIRLLMAATISPGAEALWNAVAVTVSKDGTDEEAPKSDEDWDAIRRRAVNMNEAVDLLLVRDRHVAPPGAKAANPEFELAPDRIEALIAEDWSDWSAKVQALHDVVVQAIDAIDAHDVEKLTTVGGDIDVACENCHVKYWYPDEI